MKFVIGNIVLFKKEKQRGIVLEVLQNNMLLVRTLDGFDNKVASNDVLLYNESTDQVSAYGIHLEKKDRFNKNIKSAKNQRFSKVLKIDLHIESLIDDYHSLDNFEIVNIQLKKCEKEIRDALNSNIEKIIIVHGIGVGTLRKEVHKLLKQYKLRFFISLDGGSTEVLV